MKEESYYVDNGGNTIYILKIIGKLVVYIDYSYHHQNFVVLTSLEDELVKFYPDECDEYWLDKAVEYLEKHCK